LSEEGFAKVKGAFENADETSRESLTSRQGAIGNAARKVDESYQQAEAKAPNRVTDRRIESREKRLLEDGLTPETARAVSAQGGDVNTISKITPGIPDREIVDYALDTVRDVAKIAPQTGKMVIDTARLSGEYIPIVGDILINASDSLNDVIEGFSKGQSTELQAKSRELQMMMQTGDRAQVSAFLAKNPSVMASIAIPSAGSMLVASGPGVALRALGASAEAATTATVASNALMNAGSAFSEAQGDPVARYTAALIAGGGTLLIGRMTEGGAEGAIARGLSGGGKGVAGRLAEGAKIAGREYVQEFVEGGSEATGTQVADVMSGTRDTINPQQILNQAQVEGAAGLLLGGGVGMLQAMQQDQKQQASEESQAALDAIPNANTVDEAIALFNETIKAPIAVNTPPLFQEPIANAAPAEAIDAAELVEGLPAEGEQQDVRLTNAIAPVFAGASGLESDLDTGGVGDRLDEQPGSAAAPALGAGQNEPVLRDGPGNAAVTFANAQEGQIVESGGAQFRKTENGFERVDVNTEQSTPVESQIQPDINVNEAPNITRAQVEPPAPDTVTGEKIDREWTAFADDSGTRGIPRSEMPQIKAEHRGALTNFLNARGISHEQDEVQASTLKPTQAEFSPKKVEKAKGFEGGDRSILVSADGHVLDGHHQWMAKLDDDATVPVIRLNAPIDKLLAEVSEFPSAETAGGTAPSAPPIDNQTPSDSQPSAPTLTTNDGLRPIAETIAKRRAVAEGQLGKNKAYGRVLAAAKDMMNGQPVKLGRLRIDVNELKGDKELHAAGKRLIEIASAPAKEATDARAQTAESYRKRIDEAKTKDELNALASEIQKDESLTDQQAQDLDDAVFERVDQFAEPAKKAAVSQPKTEKAPAKKADSAPTIPEREVITPADDNNIGMNRDGEKLYERNDGSRYRMHNGRPDFGGDLVAFDASDTASIIAAQRAEKSVIQPKSKPEKAAAETSEPASKIEDFGTKIGGAKKDLWSSYKDKLDDAIKEDIASVPLSKSWPDPDYQALIDNGVDQWAVAFMHAARDEIPVKPQKSWKQKSWVSQVELLRDTSYKLMNGEIDVSKARQLLEEAAKTSRGMSDIAGRMELYQLVGHAQSLKGVRIGYGEYSLHNGVEYNPAKGIWTVEKATKTTAFSNWPRELATGTTRQEALQNFKDKYASLTIQPEASKEVSFDIYSKRGENGFWIGKKVGRNYIDLERFDTVKEARAYKAENNAALVAKLEKAKEIPSVRRDTNNPRVGDDMREGRDVTPQFFGETFGFKGVEFGNYVEQKKRQQDLNDAFDALMDMAAILDIPPKAISLNGELGLAFGARGSGGIDPAKAHYEHDFVVINLTKKAGAGSLGHEWFHALDNYFSRLRGNKGEYTTEAMDVSLAARGSNFIANTAVRKEMVQAFGEVMKAIRSTALKARSSKLDAKRIKAYWNTGLEMAARSFETYLIAKLQDNNASNDYLANIVDEQTWKAAEALGWELDGSYPYPTAAEIPAIRAAFDNFFNVIQTKETDQGVALFSRGTGTGQSMKERIDAVIAANDETRGVPFVVSDNSPASLRMFGWEDLPVVMRTGSDGVMKLHYDHGLSSSAIADVMTNGLNKPVMMLQHIGRGDVESIWFVTDKVHNGDPIVIAVQPEAVGSTGKVNLVATALSRPWSAVASKIRNGDLLYRDTSARVHDAAKIAVQVAQKKYAQEPRSLLGLMPKSAPVRGRAYKVLSQSDLVKYEQATPDANLSRGTGAGIPLAKAKSIADDLAKKFPNLPAAIVVQSQNDIPAVKRKIEQAIEEFKANPSLSSLTNGNNVSRNNIEGVYANGRFYLVADNIRNVKRLKEVFAHEAIGHLSLEVMLDEIDPKLLPKLINQVNLLDKSGNRYIRNLGETVDDRQPGLDESVRAKEIIALIAERGDQDVEFNGAVRSVWQKIADAIKAFAKLVFDLDLTDRDVRDIVSMAARHARGEDVVSIYTGGKHAVMSRASRQPSKASGDTLVTAAMEYLARDPELFQRPRSEVKDIYGIAKEIDPGYRVERLGPSMTKDRDADRAWEVFVPGSTVRSGVIMTNAEEVWIDVSRLQSGIDSGSAIYDMAATFAHNNGKVLIGDPLGLSRMAYYRRNENMLSSALKYGTTRHLRPHLAQEIPSEYFTGHEKAFGESVRPLNWIEGDDVNNIKELIYNSYDAASKNIPEIKDVIFNPDAFQFERASTGEQFGDDDFRALLSKYYGTADSDGQSGNAAGSVRVPGHTDQGSEASPQPGGRGRLNPYRAGSATAKRAALFNTFLRSEGGEARKQVLGALIDQLSRGELSPALNGIFYSRSNPNQGTFNPSWDAPEPSKFDNLIYTLQDKNIDLKRVTQEIQKAGNDIDDRWNAYLQEELYHGRTAKRTQDFIRDELDPLVADMQERKVTMADFEEYLWMRHAEERNEQIAKVNPEMPDSGSGVSTAEALEYLDSLSNDKRADYEALAARIDAINAKSRQLLIDYGLESRSTIKAWQETYKHYVPLMREEMDHGFGNGTGQGFSVRGNSAKRATGSKRAVVDILANIAMQREKNIIRGEKNRVATALIGLAKLNPNPEFWDTDMVPQIKDIGKDGLVTYRPDPNYKGRDNVIVARIVNKQGKIVEHSVIFNQFDERAQRMAGSLKNLDQDQIGELLGTMSSFTRYFASINTQYNPVFGAINITRDVQGALFNLESTPLAGKQKEVTRQTGSALNGIYQEIRAVRKGKKAETKWAQLWEEFQKEGGKTGFRDMYRNAKMRGEALEHAIDPEWWQKKQWGRVVSFGGVIAAPQQWLVSKPGKALFDWLSDYNDTLENSVRLAAYKVALDQGLSKQQSASIAKNLTVNFNRKGEMGRQIGSLYAFFNASVQGTARIGETLFKEGKMTRAGKQIIGGGMLLGGMQAMMLAFAGFDDDEPPEFVRDRNLIIPIGDGKYTTIPMPLGYNAIPATGRILTEWAMDGFDEPQHRFSHLLEVYMDMFNPIGYSGISMQTLAPTALDPFAALAENKDWTGMPIAREDFSSLNPTPGFTRSKDTASSISKGMSYSINWLTGGTDYTPGIASPTPDQIDYLIGQFTGGVGREYMKLEQTATSMVTGDELPTYKIPLVGRFYGDASGQAAQGGKFYDNLIRMNKHSNEIKGRWENGGDVDAYLAENPEAELADYATSTYSAISKLRKQRNQAKEEGGSKAELKEIDQEITDLMREFNEEVRKTSKEPA
jgi:hypothetical protein